ncbi:MAG: hypothetical protein H6739_30910 [Alphaproteobacteria bacterium]|nr:hypothetical protein [Alphaproteobacteria bacterium]
MLDEESYLDIAQQIASHPLRPYDWFRPWQPWGATPPADAFLFAHPPLHLWWVALWQRLGVGPALRLAVGLPWALLLGWATGELAATCVQRPGRAALVWVTGPAVALGLASSLMIDLPVVALSTIAVTLWVTARPGLAGLALALAAFTKYPALVLLPVLGVDAWRGGRGRDFGRLLAVFAALWGAGEAWLAWSYGEPHLLRVLRTAGDIGRGPLAGRTLGALTRLGLVLAPVWALGTGRRGLVAGVAGAALTGGLLAGQLAPSELALTALLGGCGAAVLACGLMEDRPRHATLLRLWVAAGLAAVVLGHNYVGGRYLLPVAAPLALLLTPRLAGLSRARFGAMVALSAALALGVVRAEGAHARLQVAVADALNDEAAALGRPPGVFTGEWTFRWRMTALGWRFASPEERPPAGTLYAAPLHASPGPLPPGLVPLAEVVERGPGPLRLLDLERGVGYHAETLGPAPLGVGPSIAERGRLFEVR